MASTLFQPHLRRSEPDSKVYEGLQSLRPSGRSDIANDRACIWLGSRSSTSTAPRIRPPSTNHNRLIGIGGRLAAPPLPHHRAYGSVPRRFDRVRLGRAHRFGEDRASRNSGCAAPVGPTGVLTFARGPWASRPPPPH